MKRLSAALPLAAFLLLAAAPRRDESAAVIFARVPEKASAKSNPLANDPNAFKAGAKLFAAHCAECHGENGEGARRGPPLLPSVLKPAKPGEIYWILTNGVVRRGMPAWSKLPEPQRWQIVTWLKSLP